MNSLANAAAAERVPATLNLGLAWHWKRWHEILLLVGLPLLILLPATRFEPLKLDDTIIWDAPLWDGGWLQSLAKIFTQRFNMEYIPLTFLSAWLDRLVAHRLNVPWSYVARIQSSLWLGALGVSLLYFFNRLTGRPALSFLAALLATLHPISTFSVLWVGERKNLICLFFVFWSLERYLAARSGGGWKQILFCAVLMLLGFLAKIHAVVVPGIIVMWELSLGEGNWRYRLRYALTPIVLGIARVAAVLLWRSDEMKHDLVGGSHAAAIVSDGPILLRYLAHTICPVDLCLFYYVEELSPLSIWGYAAWLLVALIVGISTALARNRHLALFAWMSGFNALAPTLNLFPQTFPMADQYHQWAIPFWILSLALAVEGVLNRVASSGKLFKGRLPKFISIAALVLLASLSLERMPEFVNREFYFGTNAAREPRSSAAWVFYQNALTSSHPEKNLPKSIQAAVNALKAPDAHRLIEAWRLQAIEFASLGVSATQSPSAAIEFVEKEGAQLSPDTRQIAQAFVLEIVGKPTESLGQVSDFFTEINARIVSELRVHCRDGHAFPDEFPVLMGIQVPNADPRFYTKLLEVENHVQTIRYRDFTQLHDSEHAWDCAALLFSIKRSDDHRQYLAKAYRNLGLAEVADRLESKSKDKNKGLTINP